LSRRDYLFEEYNNKSYSLFTFIKSRSMETTGPEQA